MITFLLSAILIFSDGPHAVHAYFDSAQACEAAKADLVKQAIAHNVSEGSVVCVKQETGKFS